jgi:hypothetical protein
MFVSPVVEEPDEDGELWVPEGWILTDEMSDEQIAQIKLAELPD